MISDTCEYLIYVRFYLYKKLEVTSKSLVEKQLSWISYLDLVQFNVRMKLAVKVSNTELHDVIL